MDDHTDAVAVFIQAVTAFQLKGEALPLMLPGAGVALQQIVERAGRADRFAGF